jgi:hypothetical protein
MNPSGAALELKNADTIGCGEDCHLFLDDAVPFQRLTSASQLSSSFKLAADKVTAERA